MKKELSSVDPHDVSAVVRELGGTARTRYILEAGVHPRTLYAAEASGELIRLSRGVYRLASLPLTEPDVLAVAARMPKGVLCLTTALHLHGLTEEIPRAVHVALPRGARPARIDYPPLEVYYFSGASYCAGVVRREIDGLPARVTSPAKSVVDAFKFRSRVGQDVALFGLKQVLREQLASPAEVAEMARVCRVLGVMRPYLEALS